MTKTKIAETYLQITKTKKELILGFSSASYLYV